MDAKNLLKEHLVTILCVIAVIALAFPMVTIVSKVESEFINQSTKLNITGFQALGGFWAIFLLVGPIVLAVSKFIDALKPYRKLLGLAIPVICLVMLVLTVLFSKGGSASTSNSAGSAKATVQIGLGAIICGICHLVCTLIGFKEYKAAGGTIPGMPSVIYCSNCGNTNRPDARVCSNCGNPVEAPTFSGAALWNTVHEKAAMAADKVKTMAGSISSGAGAAPAEPGAAPAAPAAPAKKAVSVDHTTEILSLIEKLSAMRDSGILTEEEFAQKKQDLLKEI